MVGEDAPSRLEVLVVEGLRERMVAMANELGVSENAVLGLRGGDARLRVCNVFAAELRAMGNGWRSSKEWWGCGLESW